MTTDSIAPTSARVVDWYRSHATVLAAGLLGAILVGAILLSVVPTRNVVQRQATAWLADLRPAAGPGAEAPVTDALKMPTPENLRLMRQLDVTRRRLVFHANVATYFYARYYLALTIAAVTGLLAAAMLVLITRVGWQNASAYLKVTFLISAGAAAYYAAFPGMFQQAANIEQNVSLYVAYANVENELLSYLATGEDSGGVVQPPKAFVHALDRRLAELNRVPIGFDATKLPSSVDAFEGVKQ